MWLKKDVKNSHQWYSVLMFTLAVPTFLCYFLLFKQASRLVQCPHWSQSMLSIAAVISASETSKVLHLSIASHNLMANTCLHWKVEDYNHTLYIISHTIQEPVHLHFPGKVSIRAKWQAETFLSQWAWTVLPWICLHFNSPVPAAYAGAWAWAVAAKSYVCTKCNVSKCLTTWSCISI